MVTSREGVKVVSTLTPIAFFRKKSTEVLDGMHSRRVYTVNYRGDFQKHANGCRVVEVPCTNYHACAQKYATIILRVGKVAAKCCCWAELSMLTDWH